MRSAEWGAGFPACVVRDPSLAGWKACATFRTRVPPPGCRGGKAPQGGIVGRRAAGGPAALLSRVRYVYLLLVERVRGGGDAVLQLGEGGLVVAEAVGLRVRAEGG